MLSEIISFFHSDKYTKAVIKLSVAFKSIETRYRLFLSESILGSTYVMCSVPLKVSFSVPNPNHHIIMRES